MGLVLVMGLAGHPWMQVSHLSQTGSRPLDDSHVASSSHDGHTSDGQGQGSDHHFQQCTALESRQPSLNNLSRNPAIAPTMLPHVDMGVPVAALSTSPAAYVLSPRFPAHGVVLLL
jgi:hypothetical protein